MHTDNTPFQFLQGPLPIVVMYLPRKEGKNIPNPICVVYALTGNGQTPSEQSLKENWVFHSK